MASEVTFRPLHELNFVEFCNLFNAAFEGYLVPINMTPEMVAARSRREGIDHSRSFVAVLDGQDVAVVLNSPRGATARLSGMGVVAQGRGAGVGRACVAEFIRRNREQGCRRLVLEVFEQNEPAVKLYRSVGFEPTMRLFGFEREPFESVDGPELREADPHELVQVLSEYDGNLPFIQTAEHAAGIALPTKVWSIGSDAYACVVPPAEGRPIGLSSLAVRKSLQGKGSGKLLLKAIQAAFPSRKWYVPQILPESMSGFFESQGFQRMELNQFEMKLDLV